MSNGTQSIASEQEMKEGDIRWHLLRDAGVESPQGFVRKRLSLEIDPYSLWIGSFLQPEQTHLVTQCDSCLVWEGQQQELQESIPR